MEGFDPEKFVAEYFALQAMNAALTAAVLGMFAVTHMSREEAVNVIQALANSTKQETQAKGYPAVMLEAGNSKIDEYTSLLIEKINNAYNEVGK